MTRGAPIDTLRTFAVAAYESVGMAGDDAAIVAAVQLDSDRRGVDTHGLARLPWYVARLRSGDNNPRPEITVERSTAVSALLDGDNGLGQLVCTRAIETAIATAAGSGMAAVATRRSNDWGCGAHYPLRAAAAGLICFGTTTSVPTLAPFGARGRMVGNNPMVFAIPRRDPPPIVLDMALTPVALGKVLRAADERTEIPLEWGFLDWNGAATTDPRAALGGIIPAIGGYKGTGLALMMNVLAGVLPGGTHSVDVSNSGARGQLFVVISPELFGPRDEFFDRVDTMATQVHAAEPVPGTAGALLPGEPEARHATAVDARGTLEYPASVADALITLGGDIGCDPGFGEEAP